MKYFTPDLLARFGSTDETIALAASEEWERAQEEYARHLRKIEHELPGPVRSLLATYCLHDARVRLWGGSLDSKLFSFALQMDVQPDTAIYLTYQLAAQPVLDRHLSLEDPEEPLAWLYDEFDVRVVDKIKVFTHFILLTHGVELQLTFHTFHWHESVQMPLDVGSPKEVAGRL